VLQTLLALLKLFTGTIERPSPGDWLPEDAVKEWADKLSWPKLHVKLGVPPKVWVPMIPDTNSMDGVFDYGNNNILIAGATEADHKTLTGHLSVGDIAVYRTPNFYAIHRIVKIDADSDGKYFKFKGDNNASRDPDKVRESQIEWVSIGTIY